MQVLTPWVRFILHGVMHAEQLFQKNIACLRVRIAGTSPANPTSLPGIVRPSRRVDREGAACSAQSYILKGHSLQSMALSCTEIFVRQMAWLCHDGRCMSVYWMPFCKIQLLRGRPRMLPRRVALRYASCDPKCVSCDPQCWSILLLVRETGLQQYRNFKAGPPEAITGQGWTGGVGLLAVSEACITVLFSVHYRSETSIRVDCAISESRRSERGNCTSSLDCSLALEVGGPSHHVCFSRQAKTLHAVVNDFKIDFLCVVGALDERSCQMLLYISSLTHLCSRPSLCQALLIPSPCKYSPSSVQHYRLSMAPGRASACAKGRNPSFDRRHMRYVHSSTLR